MEVINITEEQKSKISGELARLVFEFKKDSRVKCIYFTPFMSLGDIEGNVVEVTLVTAAFEDDHDLAKKLQDYNLSYQQEEKVKEFGLRLFLNIDDERKYTIIDLNPSECRRSNYLLNSVILLDQNGSFTEIKEQTTRTVNNFGGCLPGVYYYYENLAEIVPPITDEIYKAMEIMQLEGDTEAVKEFTRSRLFEQFKNLK